MSDYFKAPVIVGETPGEKVQRLEADLAAATLARDEAVAAGAQLARHVLSILDRQSCPCCAGGLHDTPTGLLSEARQLARSTEATPAVEGQG